MRRCSCTSEFLPLLLFQVNIPCAEGNTFEKGTHQTTRYHQRQLFPQIPPLLWTRPLSRSLTSFSPTAATVVQKKKKKLGHDRAPFRPNRRRTRHALLWLISKQMSAISFRSFVLSSTCLIVRTKRIVELMNVLCCYYLLACACMDLLFLCLGVGRVDGGGGGKGTGGWTVTLV